MSGIRPEDRHIGHSAAQLKTAHAIAELIDFPDGALVHYEWWPPPHPRVGGAGSPRRCTPRSMRVRAPHRAPFGDRHWRVDYLQLAGTAEAPELNNPVAQLLRGLIPPLDPAHGQKRHRPRGCFGVPARCFSGMKRGS